MKKTKCTDQNLIANFGALNLTQMNLIALINLIALHFSQLFVTLEQN